MAALTASDRMITAGDVEYEPAQTKISLIAKNATLLIAGDYTVHSQAIRSALDQIGNRNLGPDAIAKIYGAAIQAIQRKEAEDRILAPLGLNTDSFLAQQQDMSEHFVSRVTVQLQEYPVADVEALVVGLDKEQQIARIYSIDKHGTARCFDDVGFATIGIGAWHAQSRLMQTGYVNQLHLAPALAAVYSAKKAAEVAPGVGKDTDIHLILRDGAHSVEKQWPEVFAKLGEIYEVFDKEREQAVRKAVLSLEGFLNEPGQKEGEEGGVAITKRDSGTTGSSPKASTDDASQSSE